MQKAEANDKTRIICYRACVCVALIVTPSAGAFRLEASCHFQQRWNFKSGGQNLLKACGDRPSRKADVPVLAPFAVSDVSVHGIDTEQIVQVAAVTFQVPKDEFLALLSAVSRGAHWQDSTSAAVPLLQDISVFEPEEHDRSQLLLAKYKGWDVEGSDVTFVPSDPLTDQEYQEFLESDKGDEDNVAPGIGIAMGLGIPMIIESLYLLAVAWRRNR
eukprot:1136622-Pelagomonas_calceolata.AAC.6